ncbi:MAG: ABC transporter ATP-binding protein [Burkholderiales bacterium]
MTLQVTGVSLSFGGIKAVSDISFTVHPGQIVALIGPNGAGKTSLINSIAGSYVPEAGTIQWKEHRLEGRAPHTIVSYGVSRTFQNVATLHDLTVLDLVKLGVGPKLAANPALTLLGWSSVRGQEQHFRQTLTTEVLTPLGLADQADQPIQTLSYGSRKIVDLARALASRPSLLLLDEPVAGLSASEAQHVASTIHGIREKFGTTVLMVEHKMDVVMGISDRIVVMASGKKIFEGLPAEVQRDQEVRRVYLGETQ